MYILRRRGIKDQLDCYLFRFIILNTFNNTTRPERTIYVVILFNICRLTFCIYVLYQLETSLYNILVYT